MFTTNRRTCRKRTRGSALAEFGPVLFVFLLITIFPFLNLMGFACGVVSVYLLAHHAANVSSKATTYQDALAAMENEAHKLAASGIARFARLRPVGGYNNCGASLYVERTTIATSQLQECGPNTPIPANPPIDVVNEVYEYETRATFVADPFVNLSNVPFIGNVPIIGRAAPITMIAQSHAEYPDGLVGTAGGPGPGGGNWQPRAP